MSRTMRVLQLYYKMPFPMDDGGAHSVYHHSLGLLSQGISLKILAMNLLKAPSSVDALPSGFREQTGFESVDVDNRITARGALVNLFHQQSYFTARFQSDAFREKLISLLKESRYDVVVLEHLYLCHYLEDIRKYAAAKVVLRTQNVENQLWYQVLRQHHNPFTAAFLRIATRRLERFECNMATRVNGIISLSENDAAYFCNIPGHAPVAAIAAAIDSRLLQPTGPEDIMYAHPILYHLGSMDWKPNIHGMKWFFSEVLPLLRQQHPQVPVCIAGKQMPAWFFRQGGVHTRVEARVDDARQYQSGKAILFVPLHSGSGIRIKILEAMAMGKAIVTTTKGIEGIPAVHGVHVLIADEPTDFAARLSDCASSAARCRHLGRAAISFAAAYDYRVTGSKTKAFLESLL